MTIFDGQPAFSSKCSRHFSYFLQCQPVVVYTDIGAIETWTFAHKTRRVVQWDGDIVARMTFGLLFTPLCIFKATQMYQYVLYFSKLCVPVFFQCISTFIFASFASKTRLCVYTNTYMSL
jgi:hypothetical protein